MDLNEEEKALCQQLRDRVSDLRTDTFRVMDFNMIRFIRARNMDLNKAEDMFRKYIAWREENDIDNAKSWDVPKELKDNFRYHVTGLGHNGGLVICLNIAEWDPSICHGRYEELMKVAFQEIEHLTHISKYFSTKRNAYSKMVAIFNLEGLTFAHCSNVDWLRALVTLLKAFEAYYPETLKLAYILSAPWVFSILWSVCKPFISTATHERLRFLGSDREVWKAEFAQFVDDDQLPENFGGTLPEGCELVLNEDGTVERKQVYEDNENIDDDGYDTNIKDISNNQRPVDSIELD